MPGYTRESFERTRPLGQRLNRLEDRVLEARTIAGAAFWISVVALALSVGQLVGVL